MEPATDSVTSPSRPFNGSPARLLCLINKQKFRTQWGRGVLCHHPQGLCRACEVWAYQTERQAGLGRSVVRAGAMRTRRGSSLTEFSLGSRRFCLEHGHLRKDKQLARSPQPHAPGTVGQSHRPRFTPACAGCPQSGPGGDAGSTEQTGPGVLFLVTCSLFTLEI